MGSIIKPRKTVRIVGRGSVVGREEARGPFGRLFDLHDESDRFGQDTWEKAESELGRLALNFALASAGLSHAALDLLFAGDLQNQCMASAVGLCKFGRPYLGLYGACSTFVEGILLATLALSGAEEATRAAVVATSHNCAAERQFRLPLEYGGQRAPTAQWTATAGGAVVLESGTERRIMVSSLMVGRMRDSGIRDAANMGAAMAPAAADSLLRYFSESGEQPQDLDTIVTGDLGAEGSAILHELLAMRGIDLGDRHMDCGRSLYDPEKQDAHAGGSGCGCIAALTAAHILPAMQKGQLRRVLLMATGALMNPDAISQGCAIIGIAPIVLLETK